MNNALNTIIGLTCSIGPCDDARNRWKNRTVSLISGGVKSRMLTLANQQVRLQTAAVKRGVFEHLMEPR